MPGYIDKLIVKALDRLHQQAGFYEPCQWRHDGKNDVYQCSHMELPGGEVIKETRHWQQAD